MDGRIDKFKYDDGAFAISCIRTGFLDGFFNNSGYTVPGLTKNTLSKLYLNGSIILNQTKDAHIDQVNWPDNMKRNISNMGEDDQE